MFWIASTQVGKLRFFILVFGLIFKHCRVISRIIKFSSVMHWKIYNSEFITIPCRNELTIECFTDQNILERHSHLNATVGFLQMEEDSLRTAYYFSWVFFPAWIILTIVQIVCFILYNGRLHPLARIIDESEVDDIGKSKY